MTEAAGGTWAHGDPVPYSAPREPRPRSYGSRFLDAVAVIARALGEVAMTLGVIVLLFVVYELYFTGIATKHAQHTLQATFNANKGKAAPTASRPPALGAGIAEIYAPRLGASYHFIVVEGTGEDQLAKGPGHYDYPAPDARELGVDKTTKPLADGSYPSAYPGQIGNLVVSGHRTTHAHPFFDANELEPGDAVIFETSTTWYVYRVTSQSSVLPSDIGVTFPVPDKAGAVPKQRLMTLTTCNPRYSASHRLIIRGVLVSQQPLSAGNPRALKTGRA